MSPECKMPATQVYLVGSRDNLFGLQPISDLVQEEEAAAESDWAAG